MITRFGLSPRRQHTTVEDFQAHWGGHHAKLARQLPGMLRYWQNHAVVDVGLPMAWPGFDVCSEIDAENVAAFDRMFASELFKSDLGADEDNLIDPSKRMSVFCERVGHEPPPTPRGVRLISFYRLAPLQVISDLERLLEDPGRAPNGAPREVFLALSGAKAGQRSSAFDAVEALWFSEAGAAGEHLRSDEHWQNRWALAGIVAGTERLLAKVKPVV